jgi:hypothetical protein
MGHYEIYLRARKMNNNIDMQSFAMAVYQSTANMTNMHTFPIYIMDLILAWYLSCIMSAFRPRGVPGPMSNLSLCVLAQMGWREMEHKGGKRGSCYPAPGGCTRSRGYKRS